MYVSEDPVALLSASLDLSQPADEQGEQFPQLRVGTAVGQAISRAGDWFGRPVNLASRVTGIARPGSVVCTEPIKDAAPQDAFTFSFIGQRRIKGVPGSTALFRARKAADGGNGQARER
jgi:adenylate cyclase